LTDALADNLRLLSALLDKHLPGVRYRGPDASYLAWLDCRELGRGENPAATFLQRGRVALEPAPASALPAAASRGSTSAGHRP
jgi:cystathionine beta-lyase